MKIVVCIRQGLDGEINPFDASAYESALQINGAEITLLSMGPNSTENFLMGLTRLGAKKAVLLSDKNFAGADTLATAYTLSLAINKIKPDLVFCGRQTLVGDTAQTGPMLSVLSGYSLITNVMAIKSIEENKIICDTREEGERFVEFPSLITLERINTLRLPRLGSKLGEFEIWDANYLGADISKCGLTGSPTRVIKTYENASGRRKCKFIGFNDFPKVLKESLDKREKTVNNQRNQNLKLKKVVSVGKAPFEYAKLVCDNVKLIDTKEECEIIDFIKSENPDVVIWGSDPWSKRSAARVAALLELGLCADCTDLETDGDTLYMIRPALSGSIIAKIKSLRKPAMATVRTTEKETSEIIVAAGYGAKDRIEEVKNFAKKISADLVATRKMVDNNFLPYNIQVGLTGKSVSPSVYVALGVSGAVHHIVGMQCSGTIIAVNPRKDAPIFDYADYGIISDIEEFLNNIKGELL